MQIPKRYVAALLSLPLALGGVTRAQEVSDPVTKPVWLKRPQGIDIARVYPERALVHNQVGVSIMRCTVDGAGRLANCQSLYEAPINEGFAKAGAQLAEVYRMAPTDKDGRPTAGRSIWVPMGFLLPGATIDVETFYPGSPASLLKPAAGGDVGCPTAAEPDRRCARHAMDWTQGPDARQFVQAAKGASFDRSAFMTCRVGDSGELSRCAPSGNVDAATASAMLSLAPLYRAKSVTRDDLPTAGGTIVMLFNWPTLGPILGLGAPAHASRRR